MSRGSMNLHADPSQVQLWTLERTLTAEKTSFQVLVFLTTQIFRKFFAITPADHVRLPAKNEGLERFAGRASAWGESNHQCCWQHNSLDGQDCAFEDKQDNV